MVLMLFTGGCDGEEGQILMNPDHVVMIEPGEFVDDPERESKKGLDSYLTIIQLSNGRVFGTNTPMKDFEGYIGI